MSEEGMKFIDEIFFETEAQLQPYVETKQRSVFPVTSLLGVLQPPGEIGFPLFHEKPGILEAGFSTFRRKVAVG